MARNAATQKEQAPAAFSEGDSLGAAAVRRHAAVRVKSAEDDVRRLLDVGLALLRDDPSSSPRVADIVSRAGVSNDAFYRAFRSKEELMAAVVDDGARRLVSYVRHQVEKDTNPLRRIRRCVDAVLEQAADPAIAATSRAVLRHAGPTGQARGVGAVEVRASIAAVLAPELAALGSPTPDRDALVCSCALFGMLEQALWSEQPPARRDVDHLFAWIVDRYQAAPRPKRSVSRRTATRTSSPSTT